MKLDKIMGKTILITGGSSGIGLQLKNMLGQSNTIITLSRSKADITCDLSKLDSIDGAVEQIRQKVSKIDILINNAGYGLYGASELLSDEQIIEQFNTNIISVMLLTKRILPLMGAGAKIVMISSACAIFPLPFRTMYCASKSALSMYAEGLRMELKMAQIDVTNICPGDIKSNFTVNRKKNFTTNDRYGDSIEKAEKKVSGREHKRMSEAYASEKIYSIIAKKRYKPMYIVGNKYKFFNFCSKILPKKTFNKILEKMFL